MRAPRSGRHRFLREALKRRVHAPTGGAWVTVELRRNVSQPLSEPLSTGTVQGERSSAEHSHLRRQRADQLQQACFEPGALRRRTITVGDTGDAAQGATDTGEGSGIVDPEALAETLEVCEQFGRRRL